MWSLKLCAWNLLLLDEGWESYSNDFWCLSFIFWDIWYIVEFVYILFIPQNLKLIGALYKLLWWTFAVALVNFIAEVFILCPFLFCWWWCIWYHSCSEMSTSQTISIGGNVGDQSISDKEQHSQQPDHLQSDSCAVESTRRSCNVTYT